MIPKILTEQHFRQAAKQIDEKVEQGVMPRDRRSVHYDLIIDGKRYPPKYVISLATRIATGLEYPAADFNAVEAKNYFSSRDYQVIDRRKEAEESIADEDDESAFPEGGERFGWHRHLERDAKIARKAKANRFLKTAKLECDVCSMDFAQKYGERGEGFIEAHHTKPVASLNGKDKTKVRDIALVCSNCHRMLHKGKQLLSVSELKALVDERTIT
jgi:predicted HNH restriction endonuclease